jgi:nucleoside 2-deoxyribosyltransferase
MAKRVYLAGPEVFLPNAVAIGAAKKSLCAELGFEGLFPLDEAVEPVTPEAIYRTCVAHMRRADLFIANLTPWRGIGADAGTVFELGYMVSTGKPCFAYTNDGADLLQRTRQADPEVRHDQGRGIWVDRDGHMVEAFALFDNLMLVHGLAAPPVVRAVPATARFTDLAGFRACLELARRA